MNWLARLFRRAVPAAPECSHLFFPVMRPDDPTKFLGQECALCKQFNPVDSVIPGYTAKHLKEHPK